MNLTMPNLALVPALQFSLDLSNLTPTDEVVFDFSGKREYNPLAMLMCGSAIRRLRKNNPDVPFSIKGAQEKSCSYARTMGFFKYISDSIPVGKKPGEAKGSKNYIPITKICMNDLQEIARKQGEFMHPVDLLGKESSRLAEIISRDNKELHKILTFSLCEILRNIPEHAKTDTMWGCGQHWDSYQLSEIAILDEGIGIYNSLSGNPAHKKYINDNAAALQLALKLGISKSFSPEFQNVSQDEYANSGFGLYMVKEICKQLGGSFCVISYNNYIKIDSHETTIGTTSFQGTAFRITLPSTGIKNSSNILSTISSKGEEEAKSLQNTFRVASASSKGLSRNLYQFSCHIIFLNFLF